MPDIEKKLRIQLYDNQMNMVSDRLVTQATEFTKGPIGTHKGPLKIEVCLFTKEDVDSLITYLGAVQGNIPLDSYKSNRGRKKSTKSVEGFRENITQELEEIATLNDVILRLRDNDFIFSSLDLLKDMGYPIQVSKVHSRSYRFMIRLMRKAKNPINDKYDPSLLIGIKDNKLVVYSGKEIVLQKEFDEAVGDKMVKVPAKAKVKFPVYLNQQERNKFRAELQLLREQEDRSPSGFYKRWVWEVKEASPEGIDFPRLDIIPSPFTK